MKRIIAAALATIIGATGLALAQQNQNFTFELPIRNANWQAMPMDGQVGYALGATQVAAYLSNDDDQASCTAGLGDIFMNKADQINSDDPVMFAIEDLVSEHCGSGTGERWKLLSSTDISEVWETNDELWFGTVVGVTDYLHFRVYASIGAEAADCFKGETIQYMRQNPRDAATWTTTPDRPFVEQMINDAATKCQIG